MAMHERAPATKVAILCGGRGTRLQPRTSEIPKALVEVNGQPIIDYIIDFYRAKQYRDFVLCVGYKADRVKAHYAEPPPDVNITFSDAGEDASMLKRIWHLRDEIEDRLFVSYCDTYIDLDLERMLADHLDCGAEITLVSAKIRSPFGLLAFADDGWATSFEEKPLLNYYIGSFVMERSAFEYMSPDLLDRPDGQGIVALFKNMVEARKLGVFEHEGAQITFNTEYERLKAEEYLGKYYTYPEGK